ncbi:Ca2+-transporting ATPase [Angomonas deanei]|nr:Ca2+-transporting ATPase [Angomonas deanei]|eukprot:EPY32060.1 Ca2+-transporting ATPase [Angomonas deanei]
MLRWFQIHEFSPEEGFFERYVTPTIHSLKVAVALAVAAIPEGLPAVVTTCLALGTQRMAKHNAIVRVLPSVETLGRCTVICSDKTGTLTTNKMSVQQVVTLGDDEKLQVYTLENTEFEPKPGCVKEKGVVKRNVTLENTAMEMLTATGTLCNDAALFYNESTGKVEKIGGATEAALLVMSEKITDDNTAVPGEVNAFRKKIESVWEKKHTLEFTRSRKSMSVLCQSTSKNILSLFVKGAADDILKRSSRVILSNGDIVPLSKSIRDKFTRKIEATASLPCGLRCMGFAFRPVAALNNSDLENSSNFEKIESDLIFTGFCGMSDPPRPEVLNAIRDCHTAGIRVLVITGDKKETAEAVCQQIGLLRGGESGVSFTGEELDAMSPSEKQKAVRSAVLFSRTDPSHKMELVKLLQNEKFICAMTGDGVNDSPALKKADIGIAMGSGTEVAKSSSNMILADDNFATIVNAVREGRSIFNNTKQFIRYLISSNIGEVACVLFTGLFGFPEALSPVQLLWVNLVTDGLPATALGFNPPDPDIMEQPPRDVDEPIVNGWLFVRYMIIGVYVGCATVAGFIWWFLINGFTLGDLATYASCTDLSNPHCQVLNNPKTARSIALSILV